jgi:hypothetical protein
MNITIEEVGANPIQQLVYKRLVERHGEPLNLYKGFGGDNVVMVEFPWSTIGIEEDGYAHT